MNKIMEKDNNKVEEETKISEDNDSKICSNYDEDCVKVPDHLYCWLGGWGIGCTDGICPFIHNTN